MEQYREENVKLKEENAKLKLLVEQGGGASWGEDGIDWMAGRRRNG